MTISRSTLSLVITAVILSTSVAQVAAQAAGQGTSQDACAFVPIDSTYDVGLHVAGVFIILVTSAIGTFSSIYLGTHDRYGKNAYIIGAIQILKFFGIGVVVSTAWIHLLADAYSNFLNPCLVGDTWINYGANFPGWIAIASSLTVQILEYFVMSREYRLIDRRENDLPQTTSYKVDQTGHVQIQSTDKQVNGPSENDVTLQEVIGHNLLDDDNSPQMQASRNIGTVMLECGVIFHSVVIGLALGTIVDGWSTLLAAIVFHQLFEGMALGTRIAATSYSKLTKFIGMGLFYPITTPFGIALGIGIRYTYNANSQTAILIQGFLDSAAGGILMYNGYVELVAVEMNHNPRFHRYSGWWKFWLYVAFILGLAAMSIIGLWA
ncbi:Zinc/iron permease [Umbelopsis sp. PMI_123]|nr:Zinc/iron permease [Umbelopsis sp. PMI_123]